MNSNLHGSDAARRMASGYRRFGGWMDAPQEAQPPLEGDVHADVVIVGAGFAGLSTALELAAGGAKVVVIEREHAGFGASGRNAGYLAGAMGLEYELFVKRVGHEQSRKIVAFYEQGVDYVEARLADHGIDCDYTPSGILRAAVHSSQEKALRKSMEMAISLGSPAEFLDSAAMRARGIPAAFLFGSYTSRGGTLDPGKYVSGLRRAAIEAGVKLYEHTAMQGWEEGPVVRIRTERGQASAPYIVVATNAYTPGLGLLKNKVAAIRVSAIETEALSRAQLAALGWRGREGIVTSHLTMESHRLTARNSLVITTKRLNYAYGSATPNVPDDQAYRALAATLKDRFPALAGLTVRTCWSGYVSMAYDALPVVGETGRHGNIFHTAGCSGHGVGTQSLMGRLIAKRIQGCEDPLLAALRHKTPSMLPEPLNWSLLKGALAAANLLDASLDRKVRKGAGGRA